MTQLNTYNLLIERLASSVKSIVKHGNIYRFNDEFDYSKLFIVLEFECYIKASLGRFQSVDSVDTTDYYDTLTNYFQFDQLYFERSYKNWVLKKIEKNPNTDKILRINRLGSKKIDLTHLDFDDLDEFIISYLEKELRVNLSVRKFCSEFESFLKMIETFSANPIHGWMNGDRNAFFIESADTRDPDIKSKIYHGLSEHWFFADKKVDILDGRFDYSKDPGYWYIEPDSSLTDAPDNYVGVEIVTPWIPGNQILSVLESFKNDFFDDLDGITNSDTGFHINIRFESPSDTKQKINWLKLLILGQDKFDLHQFERQKNKYANPIIKEIQKNFEGEVPKNLTKETLPDFENILRKTFNARKYDAINLTKFFNDIFMGRRTHQEGFVEFRGPGNDYLNGRYTLAKRVIMKYMNLMFMIDDEQYQQEYIVRLNRLYRSILSFDRNLSSELSSLESAPSSHATRSIWSA